MEYIGWAMISVLFIGVFAHIAHSSGVKIAVGAFAISACVVVFVSLACYFIGGGTLQIEFI